MILIKFFREDKNLQYCQHAGQIYKMMQIHNPNNLILEQLLIVDMFKEIYSETFLARREAIIVADVSQDQTVV